jgi:hypothetical protein
MTNWMKNIEPVEPFSRTIINKPSSGPSHSYLKRWVGRDRSKNSMEVPAQCRHCGVSWDCRGTIDVPISLVELKRKVYDKLDKEYRAGGTIRPYDY